ncbi:hypothetical protein L1887_32293 [Cichorium endivia]|nr:hypothetical protein L1887_32293 [Cichorium endivia]
MEDFNPETTIKEDIRTPKESDVIKCHNCGGLWHYAADFRAPRNYPKAKEEEKVKAFVASGNVEIWSSGDDDEQFENKHKRGKGFGECMMVHKNLETPIPGLANTKHPEDTAESSSSYMPKNYAFMVNHKTGKGVSIIEHVRNMLHTHQIYSNNLEPALEKISNTCADALAAYQRVLEERDDGYDEVIKLKNRVEDKKLFCDKLTADLKIEQTSRTLLENSNQLLTSQRDLARSDNVRLNKLVDQLYHATEVFKSPTNTNSSENNFNWGWARKTTNKNYPIYNKNSPFFQYPSNEYDDKHDKDTTKNTSETPYIESENAISKSKIGVNIPFSYFSEADTAEISKLSIASVPFMRRQMITVTNCPSSSSQQHSLLECTTNSKNLESSNKKKVDEKIEMEKSPRINHEEIDSLNDSLSDSSPREIFQKGKGKNLTKQGVKPILNRKDLRSPRSHARFEQKKCLYTQKLSEANSTLITPSHTQRSTPSTLRKSTACAFGKQKKKPHKSITDSGITRPLELLHMDLWGPSTVANTFPELRDFITSIELKIQLLVRRIRSDNGTEFNNKQIEEFLASKGIEHNFSAPYTPQQNGVVETRNRTLVEEARSMLTFANLPLTFWGEAIATACFVQNRSIVNKRLQMTPYEVLNERKPNVKFFHISGCRCFIKNNKDHLGKFAPKSDEAIFMGYSSKSVAYRTQKEPSHLATSEGESRLPTHVDGIPQSEGDHQPSEDTLLVDNPSENVIAHSSDVTTNISPLFSSESNDNTSAEESQNQNTSPENINFIQDVSPPISDPALLPRLHKWTRVILQTKSSEIPHPRFRQGQRNPFKMNATMPHTSGKSNPRQSLMP